MEIHKLSNSTILLSANCLATGSVTGQMDGHVLRDALQYLPDLSLPTPPGYAAKTRVVPTVVSLVI